MKGFFSPGRLIVSGITALATAGLVWWFSWADLVRTHLVNAAHDSFFVVFPLLICLVLVGLTVLAFRAGRAALREPREYDYGYSGTSQEQYRADLAKYHDRKAHAAQLRAVTDLVGGVLVLVSALAIALSIKGWVTHDYNVDRQYDAGLQLVKTSMPTYEQRSAQPVAAASAKSNLGDVVGDLDATRFVADKSGDTWNNLVEAKATFGGYAAVEVQHIGLTGQSSATTCAFDKVHAARRLGGNFTHSLERAIAAVHSGAKINDGDAYGFCQGNHPFVVVPLTKQVGWWYSHEVPDGVAVYDGLSGKVTYHAHVTAGELPGPVYPISLAQKQRESSAATGSFSDYWHNRTGFEDTSSDTNDPNGDNRAEFSLRKASGGSSYVTPLTERGGSSSIAAVGVLDSDTVTAGSYARFVVHQLPKPRKANSTVAQQIRGDYGDMPEWAAHMEIFEITPISEDTWVASLGQSQDINYRVMVKADGTSCVVRADGTPYRCGKATGANGNGIGNALQPGQSGSVSVPADGQLTKLTNDQLLQLQQQVTGELSRRLNAASTTSK